MKTQETKLLQLLHVLQVATPFLLSSASGWIFHFPIRFPEKKMWYHNVLSLNFTPSTPVSKLNLIHFDLLLIFNVNDSLWLCVSCAFKGRIYSKVWTVTSVFIPKLCKVELLSLKETFLLLLALLHRHITNRKISIDKRCVHWAFLQVIMRLPAEGRKFSHFISKCYNKYVVIAMVCRTIRWRVSWKFRYVL